MFEVTAQEDQLIARLYETLQRVMASPWVWEGLDPRLLDGSFVPLGTAAAYWNSLAVTLRAWRRALGR